MKKCRNCGALNKSGAETCVNCGRPLNASGPDPAEDGLEVPEETPAPEEPAEVVEPALAVLTEAPATPPVAGLNPDAAGFDPPFTLPITSLMAPPLQPEATPRGAEPVSAGSAAVAAPEKPGRPMAWPTTAETWEGVAG